MPVKNRITNYLIPRSNLLYHFCVRYKNFFENHDPRPILNGEVRFAEQMLPVAQVVFDVGANIGEWTQMALKINPNIRLHCFEPSKITFQQLLEKNFSENVVINNIGLGSKFENRALYGDHPCTGSSSLFRREGLGAIEEDVLIDTFDNYTERLGIGYVDFVKIDVEGFELEVLKGMVKAITKGLVGIIQFEYNSTYLDSKIYLKDIWNLIFEINPCYQFHEIFPYSTKPHQKYSQEMENFLYANWAIIKK